MLANLMIGFDAALSLQNVLYALMGCTLGTLIGILPGLGPLATISMLLPFTYGIDPLGALIMLAGIYYGAAYGGSTTAILVNLPGETSSVVTIIDGYQMARRGRAGVAIATAAIASFSAGCVGTIVVAAFAAPLATVAYRFGAAEYFSLMVVGLIGAVSLSSGSIPKAIGMILVGVILGCVGTDLNSGTLRFTFGQPHLWEGLEFIVLAVGVFAFGEIIQTLTSGETQHQDVIPADHLMPSRRDFRRMTPSIMRGTAIGSMVGVLPGAGLSIASFFSYALEKKVSRHRAEMGSGAIEGVAGPEAANNAAAQTAFIPTLSLGIPGSPTMALMLGAMVMHNIQPGPRVMTSNPDLFWGLIVSMLIGNLMLVILNLPLVGLWVRLLKIPYRALFPAILLFCCMGVYAAQFSTFDIMLAAGFGLAGFLFKKLDCDPAPMILGFVLGPMLEENFRRALVLSEGDFSVFVREPISATFLALAVLILVLSALPRGRQRRSLIAEE
ncbi:MAG TPA: tripartite tricarboxylate transporter permease [Kiloniellaceae bacterium]